MALKKARITLWYSKGRNNPRWFPRRLMAGSCLKFRKLTCRDEGTLGRKNGRAILSRGCWVQKSFISGGTSEGWSRYLPIACARASRARGVDGLNGGRRTNLLPRGTDKRDDLQTCFPWRIWEAGWLWGKQKRLIVYKEPTVTREFHEL